MLQDLLGQWWIFPLIVVFLFLVVLMVFWQIRRAFVLIPPYQAMIKYGVARSRVAGEKGGAMEVRKGVQVIPGGSTFVFPFFQQYEMLDMRIMTIEVPGDRVYSNTGVPIKIDWVAQVQIGSDTTSLLTAAKAFLGQDVEAIKDTVAKTLTTNFRDIVAGMTVEGIHKDRDAFIKRVRDSAAPEMQMMGMSIVSIGITELSDDKGYFEAMAEPQIAAVKRDARIATADANRVSGLKEAESRQAVAQAGLDADRNIVDQQQKLDIRKAEMKQEVGIRNAEANRVIAEKEAAVATQVAEANVLVPARADRQATIEKAEGAAAATRATASAQAEATSKTGKAEAEATQAKMEAEAVGLGKLAAARAAENNINLIEPLFRILTEADVKKAEAMANALAGLGGNVKIVDFGFTAGNNSGSVLQRLLMEVPMVATMVKTQIEALTGSQIGDSVEDIVSFIKKLGDSGLTGLQTPPADEGSKKKEDKTSKGSDASGKGESQKGSA